MNYLFQNLKSIYPSEELIAFPSLIAIEILLSIKLYNTITTNEIIFLLEIPIINKNSYRYKNEYC